MENEIITLFANGMQHDGANSSDDSEESSASRWPSPRTHDTTPALYHLKDLKIFAKRLEAAAKATLPRKILTQPRYHDVEVILMRWDGEDRLGVSCELEDLAKVFAQSYGFKTTEWFIPTENPLMDIMSKVLALVNQPSLESRLLIIYYAGHAAMNESRQQIWLRTGRWDQGLLEWFAVQPLLVNAKPDVLFLLDCCAAASAAAPSNTTVGVKETIGACAFEARAPEPGPFSFTNTLIEVLDAWKWRPMFSAAMLHSEVLARLKHPKPQRDRFGRMSEFRRSPIYVVTTTDPKAVSIELGRRNPPEEPTLLAEAIIPPHDSQLETSTSSLDSLELSVPSSQNADQSLLESIYLDGLDTQSPPASPLSVPEDPDPYTEDRFNGVLPGGDTATPHVLISLSLEGEQLLNFGDWKRWIQQCPELASCAKIEGIYQSHSTLVILSVPVMIWDWLPDDLSCTFIGYVRSANYAQKPQWTPPRWSLKAWAEGSVDMAELLPSDLVPPRVNDLPTRDETGQRAVSQSPPSSPPIDQAEGGLTRNMSLQSFASISISSSITGSFLGPSPPASDGGDDAESSQQLQLPAPRGSPSPPGTPRIPDYYESE